MAIDHELVSSGLGGSGTIPMQAGHRQVTVPHNALWFIEAVRRPASAQPVHTVFDVDRTSLTAVVPARSEHPIHDFLKRAFDITVSLVLLIVLLPLLLVIAALVALTSPGGAFFVQQRVGLHGKLFPMFKFRSMVADADAHIDALLQSNEGSGPLFKLRSDPRVTKVGRFLRKTSLDELPQLLNVLRGDMSLVGPRPALPREVRQYTPLERRRLHAKPGITGLWQVSGRSDLSWEDSVSLDLLYVDHWTHWADAKIMLRTVTTLVRAPGAY